MKPRWHFRKPRRATTVLLGVGLYIGLWLVTDWKGSPQVGKEAVEAVHGSSPGGWSSTLAYAPFLIHADYGWQKESVPGGGGSAMYFWFFGWSGRICELSHWAS